MNISFIGGGNMARAIISGLKNNGFAMSAIMVLELDADKRAKLSAEFGVQATTSYADVSLADVILLSVKPQQLRTVCNELCQLLEKQLVISIAAGVRTKDISRWLNGYAAIVRVMPNTPAQIQAGVSALYAPSGATKIQCDQAQTILNAVGMTLWLDDEMQMDAVTAISGSGPAYVFYMIEALEEAALRLGLSEDQSHILAVQTFAGASLLAKQSTDNIQTLRAQVTSKGGTTEQGILALEGANLKASILQAAKSAKDKSMLLGDELGMLEST